jgi:hypothetical protein
MNRIIKTIVYGIILTVSTQSLIASDSKEEPKITIEEMEINLAILAKEISEEKVKLYQKEALLHDMQLALLKEKRAKK